MTKVSQLPPNSAPALDDPIVGNDRSATQTKTITPQQILDLVNLLTLVNSAAGDVKVLIRDTNGIRSITLANLIKFLGTLPDVDAADIELNDKINLIDISDGGIKATTFREAFKKIGSLPNIPGTPASNDRVLVWDVSLNDTRLAPLSNALPSNSVTRAKIAPGAVGTTEVEDGTMTSAKLAAGAAAGNLGNDSIRKTMVNDDVQGSLFSNSTNQTLTRDQAFSTHRLTGSTNRTFTLPNISSGDVGNWYRFLNDSTGTLTITGNGADTIGGESELILDPGGATTLQATTTSTWEQVGGGGSVGWSLIGTHSELLTASTDDTWRGTGINPGTNFEMLLVYKVDAAAPSTTAFNTVMINKARWDAATAVTIGSSGVTGRLDTSDPNLAKASTGELAFYGFDPNYYDISVFKI